MSERKISLRFNTAITSVGLIDGRYDDEQHNRQVMPLRGKIMRIDGVYGCHIYRYSVEVQFFTDVTDEATVVAAVQAAVDEVAPLEDMFPLRGLRKPAAIAPRPQPKAPPRVIKLTAQFAGLVVKTRAAGMTASSFEQETDILADAIANHEGVTSVEMTADGVYIQIITRLTTVEAVKLHVESVVAKAKRGTDGYRGREYFPFLEAGRVIIITRWSETVVS